MTISFPGVVDELSNVVIGCSFRSVAGGDNCIALVYKIDVGG